MVPRTLAMIRKKIGTNTINTTVMKMRTSVSKDVPDFLTDSKSHGHDLIKIFDNLMSPSGILSITSEKGMIWICDAICDDNTKAIKDNEQQKFWKLNYFYERNVPMSQFYFNQVPVEYQLRCKVGILHVSIGSKIIRLYNQ